jgi:hypothetical protein
MGLMAGFAEVGEPRGSDGGSGPGLSMPKDNTTCLFRNSEPNVATFYRDQPVTEDLVEFPSGALLVSWGLGPVNPSWVR